MWVLQSFEFEMGQGVRNVCRGIGKGGLVNGLTAVGNCLGWVCAVVSCECAVMRHGYSGRTWGTGRNSYLGL